MPSPYGVKCGSKGGPPPNGSMSPSVNYVSSLSMCNFYTKLKPKHCLRIYIFGVLAEVINAPHILINSTTDRKYLLITYHNEIILKLISREITRHFISKPVRTEFLDHVRRHFIE